QHHAVVMIDEQIYKLKLNNPNKIRPSFHVIRCPQITGARGGPEHYLPGTLCVRSTVSIPRCMMSERVKHRSQLGFKPQHATIISAPPSWLLPLSLEAANSTKCTLSSRLAPFISY
ncbi:hypothetical protein CBL_20965, partial [Carabus blaptoides fortunei]